MKMSDKGSKGSIDATIPVRTPDYDIGASPPIQSLSDGRSVESTRLGPLSFIVLTLAEPMVPGLVCEPSRPKLPLKNIAVLYR